MNLKVDMHSGVPIYTQLIERVKHMVATGELKPGDQLPTVRQLAQDLRVNLNTIARAYALLNEAGIISTQQGRGTFVRAQPDERALSRMRSDKLNALVGQVVIEALSLGYKPAEIRSAFDEALKQMVKESKR
ncbi:MAG TPA: GntR family transcriptional regulator [Anaerolineae bacterium]|nr:GntR family transcriptional regulator [Anaerolineae bacterium]